MHAILIALCPLASAAAHAHDAAGGANHSHLNVDEIFGLIAIACVAAAWLVKRKKS